MNFLREVVGGPKNRYREDGYNLDLTYITGRIIAMAFPASGFEKLFRNSADVVSELLSKNHRENYMTINISGREVDQSKMKNVRSFQWEDHCSPPIESLFNICDIMAEFLSKNSENVVVIHCNHGKGRTGTLICCFLLFLQICANPEHAREFYAKKRFEEEGKGVTQPAQIRYINYFFNILQSPNIFPKPLVVSSIKIRDQSMLNNPYFKVKDVHSKKYVLNTHEKKALFLQIQKEKEYQVNFSSEVILAGDCIMEVKNESKIGKNLVGSFFFNTVFANDTLSVKFEDLSPLSLVRNSGITEKFTMKIYFRKLCKCKFEINCQEKCNACAKYVEKEKNIWQKIHEIIEKREKYKNLRQLAGLIEIPKEEKAMKMERKNL